MSRRTLVPGGVGWVVASLCCAAFVLGAAPRALACSIQYGDFGPDFPPGVTIYQDVRESSGTDAVPLHGAPSLSGDSLDFDPMGFVASSTGGDGDITDGQLNLDIAMLEVNDIVAGGMDSILLSESGDFTLFGSGTALTSVAAGISLDLRILEVDGDAISPISVFASNSIARDLVSDGPVVLAPWSNGLLIELGPVLVANDIDFEFGVTRAELVIDDQLIALSEPDSLSFIAKKDLTFEPGIVLNPAFVIPEPSTAVLLLVGLTGLVLRRRAG
jgi:hypothetical protein